ncbi:MAG: tetratricopeptide repeat protein [Anaerolineae bacterium]|nr:tetratricopeptide repeat protein [Anaerolineae bacterium]
MPDWNRGLIRRTLGDRLDLEDLQTAAYDLGVEDYEGRVESELLLYILTFLEKRGRMQELMDWLKENRTDIDISAFIKPTAAAEPGAPPLVSTLPLPADAPSPPPASPQAAPAADAEERPLAAVLIALESTTTSAPDPAAVAAEKALQALKSYDQGVNRLERRDWSGAMGDFSQAISLKPDYVDAYVRRGLARLERGDRAGALEDLNQALTLKPARVDALQGRARVRLEIGDCQGAEVDLSRVIELRPGDEAAYAQRGRARVELGDLDGALADYNQAIDLRVDNPKLFLGRAIARRRLGDALGAIQDLETARRLQQPDDPMVLYHLAGAYLEAEQTRKARDMARAALDVMPAEKLYYRASLTALVGESEAALAGLEAAIQADSGWCDTARADPNWRALKANARFQNLVGEA